MRILIFILVIFTPRYAMCQAKYGELYLSTMEVVDKDHDGNKEGLEIHYILKDSGNTVLEPEDILRMEAYLYEDTTEEVLMTFWQIDSSDKNIYESPIYLPFREGFAYNVYEDKIIPAILRIKIFLKNKGEKEIETSIKDKLSFLSY